MKFGKGVESVGKSIKKGVEGYGRGVYEQQQAQLKSKKKKKKSYRNDFPQYPGMGNYGL